MALIGFSTLSLVRFPSCVLHRSRHLMFSTNPCTLALLALSFSPYRDRGTFSYSYHAHYGAFVLIGRNWYSKRENFFYPTYDLITVTHLFGNSNFLCSRTHPFRTRAIVSVYSIVFSANPLNKLTRGAWCLLNKFTMSFGSNTTTIIDTDCI